MTVAGRAISRSDRNSLSVGISEYEIIGHQVTAYGARHFADLLNRIKGLMVRGERSFSAMPISLHLAAGQF